MPLLKSYITPEGLANSDYICTMTPYRQGRFLGGLLHPSVIFVLTYFLVLVLVAVFEIFLVLVSF